MHFLSPSRYSGCDAQCIAFARWFHARGIAWRGTPSELVSELSSSANVQPTQAVFSGGGELLAFLEQNTEVLRELGVEELVDKRAGRPTRIILRSTMADDQNELTPAPESIEVTTSDGSTQRIVGIEADTLTRSSDMQKPAEMQEEDPSFNIVGKEQPSDELREFLAGNEADDRRRARIRVPLIVVALTLLVLAAAVFAFSRYGNGILTKFPSNKILAKLSTNEVLTRLKTLQEATLRNAPATASPAQDSNQSTQGPSGDEPNNRHDRNSAEVTATNPNQTDIATTRLQDLDFKKLFRQASETTAPAAQEELGLRYAEGRGVERDPVAAYTWLVLARSNGGPGSDDLLRKLGGELSQTELERVRISLGNSYAQGTGVPQDLAIAYSWYTLAEVAGSADATLMKKTLEASMTPEQIKQGQSRATEWLSRHSNRTTQSSDSVSQ